MKYITYRHKTNLKPRKWTDCVLDGMKHTNIFRTAYIRVCLTIEA